MFHRKPKTETHWACFSSTSTARKCQRRRNYCILAIRNPVKSECYCFKIKIIFCNKIGKMYKLGSQNQLHITVQSHMCLAGSSFHWVSNKLCRLVARKCNPSEAIVLFFSLSSGLRIGLLWKMQDSNSWHSQLLALFLFWEWMEEEEGLQA